MNIVRQTPADAGLRCPGCRASRWHVIKTTPGVAGQIVRRRECLRCGMRITTIEQEKTDAIDRIE